MSTILAEQAARIDNLEDQVAQLTHEVRELRKLLFEIYKLTGGELTQNHTKVTILADMAELIGGRLHGNHS